MIGTMEHRKRIAFGIVTLMMVGLSCACDRSYTPTSQESLLRSTIALSTSELPFEVKDPTLEVIYAITNISCLKPKAISGAIPSPQSTISVRVTKISDGLFEAEIPLTPYYDENYDGRGPCHWAGAAATFGWTHQGHRLEATISRKTIEAEGSEKRYFTEWSFTSAPTDQPQVGFADASAFGAINGQKIYSVTLTVNDARHQRSLR